MARPEMNNRESTGVCVSFFFNTETLLSTALLWQAVSPNTEYIYAELLQTTRAREGHNALKNKSLDVQLYVYVVQCSLLYYYTRAACCAVYSGSVFTFWNWNKIKEKIPLHEVRISIPENHNPFKHTCVLLSAYICRKRNKQKVTKNFENHTITGATEFFNYISYLGRKSDAYMQSWLDKLTNYFLTCQVRI